MTNEYLERNKEYWKRGYKGYPNENIESFVFRPYGRIIEKYLDTSKKLKMLDFGCGAGAPTQFYQSKGFDVYGVDISERNISICKERMPQVADHFRVIEPTPDPKANYWGGGFDLVVALQSLYYFSNKDLEIALQNIYSQMNKGALIYATMIGEKCWCFDHSKEFKDGLRRFEVSNQRSEIEHHFVNFTHDEADLMRKFSMFKKLHIGFHSEKYREDEGVDFHYTFVGQKLG